MGKTHLIRQSTPNSLFRLLSGYHGFFKLTHWSLGDLDAILKMQFYILLIGMFKSSHDNSLRWMPRYFTDDKSTLVQVMATVPSVNKLLPEPMMSQYEHNTIPFSKSNVLMAWCLVINSILITILAYTVQGGKWEYNWFCWRNSN